MFSFWLCKICVQIRCDYPCVLTSGVSVLRCEMNAGTDMMWRRKDLSRLSEKCAAITGLKHTRIKSPSHYRSLHRNRATDVIRLWDVSESKASSHGNRPEWQCKNGCEGSFGKGRSGSCQSICKQNLQTKDAFYVKCLSSDSKFRLDGFKLERALS